MSALFLTTKELMKRFDVSHTTVVNWRNNGGGPPYMRIGHAVRYPVDDVERYERERTVMAGSVQPMIPGSDSRAPWQPVSSP